MKKELIKAEINVNDNKIGILRIYDKMILVIKGGKYETRIN